jgi:ribosomal protein L31E
VTVNVNTAKMQNFENMHEKLFLEKREGMIIILIDNCNSKSIWKKGRLGMDSRMRVTRL